MDPQQDTEYADMIATHIVDKLVECLKDEKTVEAITQVWGRQLDQHIGRTVRRGALLLFGGFCVLVSLKFQAVLDFVSGK